MYGILSYSRSCELGGNKEKKKEEIDENDEEDHGAPPLEGGGGEAMSRIVDALRERVIAMAGRHAVFVYEDGSFRVNGAYVGADGVRAGDARMNSEASVAGAIEEIYAAAALSEAAEDEAERALRVLARALNLDLEEEAAQ